MSFPFLFCWLPLLVFIQATGIANEVVGFNFLLSTERYVVRLLTVLLRKNLLRFCCIERSPSRTHRRAQTHIDRQTGTPVYVTPVKHSFCLLVPYRHCTLWYVECRDADPLATDLLGPGSPAAPTSVMSLYW